ncbi:MAG: hypothetical protein IPM57_06385 [Oligoflexia bacterium]|nr:hypothetical protein [Oligoflexia bacterium]
MYTSQWTLQKLKSLLEEEAKASAEGSSGSKDGSTNENATKVLVLINENSPVLSPLLFLKRKGYRIKIIHKLSEAITEITKNRPDILMISWNLKRVDVRKIYQLLTKNSKLLCCIFGEDNNPRTSNTMMRSGIPNAIFPPLSGPGVHMRLQALLKKAEKRKTNQKPKVSYTSEQNINVKSKKKVGYTLEKEQLQIIKSSPQLIEQTKTPLFKVMSNLKDVPTDAKWSEVEKLSEASRIFEGISKKNERENFYYFKGSSMPVLNKDKTQWTIPEEKLPVINTEREADEKILEGIKNNEFDSLMDEENKDQVYNFKYDPVSEKTPTPSYEIFEGEDVQKGSDLRMFEKEQTMEYEAVEERRDSSGSYEMEQGSGNNMSEDELKIALEKAMLTTEEPEIQDNVPEQAPVEFNVSANAQMEFKSNDPSSILAKCVKQAVEQIAQSDQVDIQQIKDLTRVTVTIIKSEHFNGYLLGGNAMDICDRNLMKKVTDHLYEKMNIAGHPLEPVVGVLELQFDPIPFMLWAEKNADFFVKSNYGAEQVVFAYIPVDKLPEIKEAENNHLYKVDLTNIIQDERVLFDVYIHMPKNNKYLLYLKKGAVFTAKTINKLAKFQVDGVYIKNSELNLYYSYCAKNKFLESAQEIIDRKKAVA